MTTSINLNVDRLSVDVEAGTMTIVSTLLVDDIASEINIDEMLDAYDFSAVMDYVTRKRQEEAE